MLLYLCVRMCRFAAFVCVWRVWRVGKLNYCQSDNDLAPEFYGCDCFRSPPTSCSFCGVYKLPLLSIFSQPDYFIYKTTDNRSCFAEHCCTHNFRMSCLFLWEHLPDINQNLESIKVELRTVFVHGGINFTLLFSICTFVLVNFMICTVNRWKFFSLFLKNIHNSVSVPVHVAMLRWFGQAARFKSNCSISLLIFFFFFWKWEIN